MLSWTNGTAMPLPMRKAAIAHVMLGLIMQQTTNSTPQPPWTHNAPTYQISAKSDNLQRSY